MSSELRLGLGPRWCPLLHVTNEGWYVIGHTLPPTYPPHPEKSQVLSTTGYKQEIRSFTIFILLSIPRKSCDFVACQSFFEKSGRVLGLELRGVRALIMSSTAWHQQMLDNIFFTSGGDINHSILQIRNNDIECIDFVVYLSEVTHLCRIRNFGMKSGSCFRNQWCYLRQGTNDSYCSPAYWFSEPPLGSRADLPTVKFLSCYGQKSDGGTNEWWTIFSWP